MPGRTTGDNKFGPGPYVVGPILGDGVNYDTIQSAVNAASADGYPVVYVRPNTYSESVVFPAEVTLVGAEVDGRDAYVLINGNCTTSGNGVFSFRNIAFTAAAGDVFFSDAAGGVSSFRFNNCYVSGPAGVVGLAFDASGGQVFLALEDSSVIMNSNGINLTGGCQATIEGSTLESGIAVALSLTGTGNTAEVRDCKISAQNDDAINLGNNAGSVVISSSTLMAGAAGFDIGAGSSVQATHCTLESNNGLGFWVTGGGDFSYADMVLTGTALNIDTGSLNSVTALPWQQYAEAAAAGPGSVRGTASFNSADFTVVDGFVSAAGGGGGVSLSPYIVGTDANSDFNTIQDAIDQVVLDGVARTIYVKPNAYGENLDLSNLPDRTVIQAFTSIGCADRTDVGIPASTTNLGVVLNGTITLYGGVGSYSVTIQGITIADTLVSPFILPAGGDCFLNLIDVHYATNTANPIFDASAAGAGLSFRFMCTSCQFQTANGPLTTSTGAPNILGFHFQDCRVVCGALWEPPPNTFYLEANNSYLRNINILRGVGLAGTFNLLGYGTLWDTALNFPVVETDVCQINMNFSNTKFNTNGAAPTFITNSTTSDFLFENCVVPYYPEPETLSPISLYQCSSPFLDNLNNRRGEVRRSFTQTGALPYQFSWATTEQYVAQTVGAATTTAATFDLSAFGQAMTIQGRAIARSTTAGASATFTFTIGVKFAAGTHTLLPGTPSVVSFPDAAIAAATITATGGATLTLDVTGVAAHTINWAIEVDTIKVRTNL